MDVRSDIVLLLQPSYIEEITIGSTPVATAPVTNGHFYCNTLIDTGVTKSCISKKYY